MFTINRFIAVSEVELLIREKLDRKTSESFCIELYLGLFDIIVSALNNETEDRLIDRLDLEFRERNFNFHYRNMLFDYTFNLLEEIRSHFLKMGANRNVKYLFKPSTNSGMVGTDSIVIDFENTAYSFLNYSDDANMKLSEIVEDNPSLDILNELYEREENKTNKNKP